MMQNAALEAHSKWHNPESLGRATPPSRRERIQLAGAGEAISELTFRGFENIHDADDAHQLRDDDDGGGGGGGGGYAALADTSAVLGAVALALAIGTLGFHKFLKMLLGSTVLTTHGKGDGSTLTLAGWLAGWMAGWLGRSKGPYLGHKALDSSPFRSESIEKKSRTGGEQLGWWAPEAYRRWGCSVFIPYFASRDDIESVNNKTGNRGSEQTAAAAAAAGGQPNATREETATSKQTEPNLSDANKQQLVKNISISRKSSRRKTQRVRVRPCLDVCQTVEQKCPYMLPGDRAPAYPTQYAGEPTFLCRDLNIEETGEQLRKSNNGPTDCCYDHCGANPIDGLCGRCDPLHNDTEPAEGDEPPVIAAACPSITSTPSSSSQSAQCRLSQVAAITSIASFTTTTTAAATTTSAATTMTSTTTPTPGTATSIKPPKSGDPSAPSTTSLPKTSSSSSSSSSSPSSSIPSSASRALSALLRTLCALVSVYRAHSSHSLIVLVAVLTVGTELVACTKQLVHLVVVL
uniref:Uncharacterized protein n=1 Tax=Anopheles albimanus TaxID=7167 RepID=A0A182FEG4_ANOAL